MKIKFFLCYVIKVLCTMQKKKQWLNSYIFHGIKSYIFEQVNDINKSDWDNTLLLILIHAFAVILMHL